MVSFPGLTKGFLEYGFYSFLSDLILVDFGDATLEVVASRGLALATDYYNDFGNARVNTCNFSFPHALYCKGKHSLLKRKKDEFPK